MIDCKRHLKIPFANCWPFFLILSVLKYASVACAKDVIYSLGDNDKHTLLSTLRQMHLASEGFTTLRKMCIKNYKIWRGNFIYLHTGKPKLYYIDLCGNICICHSISL